MHQRLVMVLTGQGMEAEEETAVEAEAETEVVEEEAWGVAREMAHTTVCPCSLSTGNVLVFVGLRPKAELITQYR